MDLHTNASIFRTDFFVPRYRPIVCGDWEVRLTPMCLMPGYWSGPVLVFEMAALLRNGACWMSITPLELESQEVGIRSARGHVLIFGLGLGWAAAATACQAEVTAVTVVEQDPAVIELHRELDVFAQLPDAARSKIRIVEGDAFAFVPDRPVNLLMPDIWLPLFGDGRLDEVRRMQANVGARAIYFWGQELELARHAVAGGFNLDHRGLSDAIEWLGLPLIGPEYPGYAEKLVAATRRCLRGRWLPGSTPHWQD